MENMRERLSMLIDKWCIDKNNDIFLLVSYHENGPEEYIISQRVYYADLNRFDEPGTQILFVMSFFNEIREASDDEFYNYQLRYAKKWTEKTERKLP